MTNTQSHWTSVFLTANERLCIRHMKMLFQQVQGIQHSAVKTLNKFVKLPNKIRVYPAKNWVQVNFLSLSCQRMGITKASVKIANSTYKDVWIKVDSDRAYLVETQRKLTAEIKGVQLGVESTKKFDWIKQTCGYSRIPSNDFINFDVPQGKMECYVSAFDADGNWFGDAKCFRATNGTYFNVVLCDDFAMRKGFKNKCFRCAEGSQEYWGPAFCPGCRTHECMTPIVSGSDGWCEKHPRGY